MKKKVIGLCTLLLVLLLGCCTNSYGYTIDDLVAYAEEVLTYPNVTAYQIKAANNIINRKDWLVSQIGSNYTGWVIHTSSTSSTSSLSLHCWNSTTTVDTSNLVSISPSHFVISFADYRDTSNVNWKTTSNNATFNREQKMYFFGLVETNSTLPDDPNLLLNGYNPSTFEFNLATVRTIPVTYNNVTETFYKFNYSRSVGSWMLGDFTADSGDLVQIKLYRFLNDEYTDFFAGSDKKGDYINNYGLGITYDNHVFVNNAQLYYNQGYKLMIDLNGESVDSYLIYFLPYSSNASSGDLISPDVDTNADLKIIQSIEDLVDPQEVDTVYDEYIDKPSGELLGLLGYDDYNNYYSDYIKSLFTQLQVALDGTEGVSFTFPFMGRNITIYSIDFITPPGILKTFVSSFLVFAFAYFIYCQYMHFFHQLQEANLFAAVDTFSVNDESILM